MNRKVFLFFLLLLGTLKFQAAAQQFHSEEGFKNYFQSNAGTIDAIEGIWSVNTIQEYYHYDTLYEVDKIPRSAKVAIIRRGNTFESYNLSGEPYDVQFSPTDVSGVYFYKNFLRETNEYSKANAVISGKSGEMEYTYDFPDDFLRKKLGDSYEEGTRVVNKIKWTKIFPSNKK